MTSYERRQDLFLHDREAIRRSSHSPIDNCGLFIRHQEYKSQVTTILDKTVEKIVYLDSIFLNIVPVPVLPSPPFPESNVVVYSKKSLIPGRLWEATLDWGKGFSFRKGVVLEIALLRRRVDVMGKTFSSSFVQDCSYKYRLCSHSPEQSRRQYSFFSRSAKPACGFKQLHNKRPR